MREININRQLLGLEDLLFGVGIVTQIRAGQSVNLTRINAGNLPFNETQSLLEWSQSVNLEGLGSMTAELQAIYDNLIVIGNVEDNLVVVNSLNTNITVLQSLYTNISKLQNIDTNMTKLQNINTNMTKLQNIDSNITKLQAIYSDLTKLESLYNNLAMLTTIYNNSTALNNINSQVIPNLTELLLVNDNAAQVAADKLIVQTDKGTIAGYKNDVSVMKLAVETIYDTFDDRFLGSKANDPTVDNDGNALIDGAMYFDTSNNAMKVYDLGNTVWVTIPQIYLSGLLDVQLTSITTGDLLTWNGTKWVNTRTPKVNSIQLNGGNSTEGILSWNTNEGTANLTLPGGSTLQIGQEEVRTVRNSTASPIPDGTLVMFDGTIGTSGRVKVKPFTGGFSEAHLLYGMTTQLIAANSDGIINIAGKVRGTNTTGSLYGETWVDGDILYAKPDGTGALTKVVPADDKLKLRVAAVVHSHTSGTLEIRFTPFNENMYYTKTQSDALKVPINLSAATGKTTPVDADLIAVSDSDSSFSLKKLSWLNLKATIKTYFDTLFVKKITSVDNTVPRFNSNTGELKTSGVIIDDNGNLGISTTPRSRLDMGADSNGANQISWHTSSTRSIGNIWQSKSGGRTVIGNGLKGSTTITDGFESSISTSTWARSAVELDYGSIKFYTNTPEIVSYGTAYTPTERVKIAQTGELEAHYGIKLPNSAIADVNTLDWYEEGTFTPTAIGSTTAGVVTYTHQYAKYTRIGNICHFSLWIGVSAHTGTGNLYIGGLPFTSNNVTGQNTAVTIANAYTLTYTGSQISGYIGLNVNIIIIEQFSSGSTATTVPVDTAFRLMISGSYTCA